MTKPTLGIAVDSFLPRWDGIARAVMEFVPHLTEAFNIRLIAPRYAGERSALKHFTMPAKVVKIGCKDVF